MIQSMTGYGRGSAGNGGSKVIVQIKSVNGRFLDLKIHGFDIDYAHEKSIRDIISDELIRGTIHVTIEGDRNNKIQSMSFNEERFEAIEKILLMIQKKYGRHLDMGDIIGASDLFTHAENNEMSAKDLSNAVRSACKNVIKMRKVEGEKLKSDFSSRLGILRKVLNQINENIPFELEKRVERYRLRISELMNDISVDESRMSQEIAMLAEKADVTEEIVRLKSHFDQFSDMLGGSDPVGRRLNFLLQEISREINTIGSKSTSEKIVNYIITMKDETEKMREQVQNIL